MCWLLHQQSLIQYYFCITVFSFCHCEGLRHVHKWISRNTRFSILKSYLYRWWWISSIVWGSLYLWYSTMQRIYFHPVFDGWPHGHNEDVVVFIKMHLFRVVFSWFSEWNERFVSLKKSIKQVNTSHCLFLCVWICVNEHLQSKYVAG